MNRTNFALKRAFQATLRVAGPLARRFGLTPARFDMLYAVHLHDKQIFRQSDLRRMLGVSAATVSRMLKSLEELDFVYRCIDPDSAREVNVGLTNRGRDTIRRAIDAIIREDLPQLPLDIALGGRRWFDDRVCVARTRTLDALLRGIRDTFYDEATLDYGDTRRPRPIALILRPDPDAPPEPRRRRTRPRPAILTATF